MPSAWIQACTVVRIGVVEHAAPVRDDAPQLCTINHGNNFKRQFVQAGNVACRAREGPVTSSGDQPGRQNVGGPRYNGMQPESMRTPSWRSQSFAFSGAEHAVYPYS